MRVLVVGTVPPPGGAAAMRLLGVVGERRADGDSVEIVSPDERSAAHRHARLAGPLLAVELAWSARRFDAVVLDLEPGLPLPGDAGRLLRALTLASLGEALRGYREVTVRLPSPIPIPGGVGGRPTRGLWSRCTLIVVQNEDDRARLLLAPGVSAERVKVEEPVAPGRSAADDGWPNLLPYDSSLRARAQALVYERADRDRELIGPRSAPDVVGPVSSLVNPFEGASGGETGLSSNDLARLAWGRARHISVKVRRALR